MMVVVSFADIRINQWVDSVSPTAYHSEQTGTEAGAASQEEKRLLFFFKHLDVYVCVCVFQVASSKQLIFPNQI